ncbi:hypothetical protein B0H14DRAFT_2623739 [Mycena olivaceomarginata]|nr:hypothetical protein B0H14DRAFT_2623739 [Mycena olivaceomarginata]
MSTCPHMASQQHVAVGTALDPSTHLNDRYGQHRLNYAAVVVHDVELPPPRTACMTPSTHLNVRCGRRRLKYAVIVAHDVELLPTKNSIYAAVVVHDIELSPTKNVMTPSTYLNI